MGSTSGAARAASPSSGLSELEARILEFERVWTADGGAKASAIRAEFALTPARYHRMLSDVLESPAALRHDPLLVRRLQRVRDSRTAARAARSFRTDPQDPID